MSEPTISRSQYLELVREAGADKTTDIGHLLRDHLGVTFEEYAAAMIGVTVEEFATFWGANTGAVS